MVEKKIKKIPRQKIFSAESICRDFSIKTVKSELRQLLKKKEIGVISHDLYFRPKQGQEKGDIDSQKAYIHIHERVAIEIFEKFEFVPNANFEGYQWNG